MLKIKFLNSFKKDYKRIVKRGYDIALLENEIRMLADGDAAEALFDRGKHVFFGRALAVTVIRMGVVIRGDDHSVALSSSSFSFFFFMERATRMTSRFKSEIMVLLVSRPMMVLKSSSREVQKK